MRAHRQRMLSPAKLGILRAQGGFTLMEALIALSILGFVAAVAVPQLSNRLDSAFSDADLAQIVSSARMLPVRLAILGTELKLDTATARTALADAKLPLDLPPRWSLEVEKAPVFGRSGSCEEGTLVLTEPIAGQRWRLQFARISCELTITSLQGNL